MSVFSIEHPDITRAERFGSRPCEDKPVRCPVCGQECSDYFKRDGDILGCDMCVDVVDAFEHQEKLYPWG